jgi:hypothetical protein
MSCLLCYVLFLRRAGHSSRGVILNVVCLSVISKPQHLEGLPNHKKAGYKQKMHVNTHTLSIYDNVAYYSENLDAPGIIIQSLS